MVEKRRQTRRQRGGRDGSLALARAARQLHRHDRLRRLFRKSGAHKRDGFFDVVLHEQSRHAQHAITEMAEPAVTPRVRASALYAVAAVDFDDELVPGCTEVGDAFGSCDGARWSHAVALRGTLAAWKIGGEQRGRHAMQRQPHVESPAGSSL